MGRKNNASRPKKSQQKTNQSDNKARKAQSKQQQLCGEREEVVADLQFQGEADCDSVKDSTMGRQLDGAASVETFLIEAETDASDMERARRTMVRRLDAMRRLLWRYFPHDPFKTIDRALKIEELEAALLGVDATGDRSRFSQTFTFDKLSIVALRECLGAEEADSVPPAKPQGSKDGVCE